MTPIELQHIDIDFIEVKIIYKNLVTKDGKPYKKQFFKIFYKNEPLKLLIRDINIYENSFFHNKFNEKQYQFKMDLNFLDDESEDIKNTLKLLQENIVQKIKDKIDSCSYSLTKNQKEKYEQSKASYHKKGPKKSFVKLLFDTSSVIYMDVRDLSNDSKLFEERSSLQKFTEELDDEEFLADVTSKLHDLVFEFSEMSAYNIENMDTIFSIKGTVLEVNEK